mgnify:CR=1 FL=1|jgi:hypothetical protein
MRKILNTIKTAAHTVKEGFRNIKTAACRKINTTREVIKAALTNAIIRSNTILAATRGENFVDSGIKILIAVVIGALLLGGLYALFGDTIMPTVTKKVQEMFAFKG